jgi:hypothetical protein
VFGGFVTHALPDGALLGLKVTDLTLTVLEHAGADTMNMLPLDDCSGAQIRGWLGQQMAARGLDPYALDDPPPYEMPKLANGAVYAVAGLANLLGVLAVWYSNANAALGASRLHVIERNLEAPPVRCWPTTSIWIYWSRSHPAAPWASGSHQATAFTMSPIFMSVSILDPM